MVLLSVVACAGRTTALAGEKTDGSTVSSSFASVAKPSIAPTSGEPDVGQTPHPTVTTGSVLHAQTGKASGSRGNHFDIWLGWILKLWAIQYLGAR